MREALEAVFFPRRQLPLPPVLCCSATERQQVTEMHIAPQMRELLALVFSSPGYGTVVPDGTERPAGALR
ncbi:putative membrane protein [Streptomyces azureus]|uniref:Putative membrane protein n=1 Tax=Streptomyces azureus TaxID=146537 RepID=A0A0K8PLK4_STRAJ|nr:putative membrane protein [Streptomyces azureus]